MSILVLIEFSTRIANFFGESFIFVIRCAKQIIPGIDTSQIGVPTVSEKKATEEPCATPMQASSATGTVSEQMMFRLNIFLIGEI